MITEVYFGERLLDQLIEFQKSITWNQKWGCWGRNGGVARRWGRWASSVLPWRQAEFSAFKTPVNHTSYSVLGTDCDTYANYFPNCHFLCISLKAPRALGINWKSELIAMLDNLFKYIENKIEEALWLWLDFVRFLFCCCLQFSKGPALETHSSEYPTILLY